MTDIYDRFSELFRGLERAHGFFNVEDAPQGEKRQGDRGMIHEPVTELQWREHLSGQKGLGICPINDEGTCLWGAIDIDVYSGLDHKQLANHFPDARVCKSKSGGAHIYFFFKKPMKAARVQEVLRGLASSIGRAGAEVFPKQKALHKESGDVGSWINLPYFNGDLTERYCVDQEGNRLSLEEFVKTAEERKLGARRFVDLTVRQEIDDFTGGPPCLVAISSQGGLSKGNRNTGVFNYAVLAHKKFPKDADKVLLEWNNKYCHPPLDVKEVLQISRSVEKKGTFYTCSQPPIKDFCHKSKCKQCQYGINTIDPDSIPSALRVILTDPKIWIAEVYGKAIEFTTKQIQNQRLYGERVMEKAHAFPTEMRGAEWRDLLNKLMDPSCLEEIPAPPGSLPIDQLREHLTSYADTHLGTCLEDLVKSGLPWYNEGHLHFMHVPFMAYLREHRFDHYKNNELGPRLKELGAKHEVLKFNGKSYPAYKIKWELSEASEPLPEMPNEAI